MLVIFFRPLKVLMPANKSGNKVFIRFYKFKSVSPTYWCTDLDHKGSPKISEHRIVGDNKCQDTSSITKLFKVHCWSKLTRA